MLANAIEAFVQVTHMNFQVTWTLAGFFFVAVATAFIPMCDLGKLPKVCPIFLLRLLLQLPQIEFDPEDIEFDVEKRYRFWAALRPWFQKHGYHLYLHSHNEDGTCRYFYPQIAFPGKDEFPFAHLGGDEGVLALIDFGDEPHANTPAFASWEILNVLALIFFFANTFAIDTPLLI